MDMNQARMALQQEAGRRGMLGGQSNVGTQPNPSASMPMQGGQGGNPPLPEAMYKDASNMMNKAQPNESQIILKALIKRLGQNPIR